MLLYRTLVKVEAMALSWIVNSLQERSSDETR